MTLQISDERITLTALPLEGEGWVGVDCTRLSSADARFARSPAPNPLPAGEGAL